MSYVKKVKAAWL